MKIKYGIWGVGGNPYFGWAKNGIDSTILVTDKYH